LFADFTFGFARLAIVSEVLKTMRAAVLRIPRRSVGCVHKVRAGEAMNLTPDCDCFVVRVRE
jgi:hypothetical protein